MLRRTSNSAHILSFCVIPFLITVHGGIGISTDCPSLTPLGLSLGPDLPWADEPSPGNLRLSTVMILTSLSLLIPAFSLLLRPHVLTIMLRPTTVSSPTTCISTHPQLRYTVLAPFIFGADSLDQ